MIRAVTRRPAVAVAALAAAGLAACSSGSTATHAATAGTLAASASASAPASVEEGPVAAVPGTSNNEYVAGPFTVTLKGFLPLPTRYDEETTAGTPIPESCAQVNVKNTSKTFTGWTAPEVEFVKGHSVIGQVLGTEPAGPPAGGGIASDSSDTLAPGQSQVLYACPQGIPAGTYVEAQLISVAYGTPGEGTIGAATVPLKY